jgi:starch synthase
MSSKSISVLYVTSESLPYIRIQSLGDISFSYVMAMREQGMDIRLSMPRYGVISERKHQIHYIKRLIDVPIPIGKEEYPASIKSSSMNSPRTKVQAYITTNEKYFSSQKGVYRDAKTLELFPNNDERFLYFSRSVLETCTLLEWIPDIVHCVDGETALVPAFFKLIDPEKFAKTKFVLTIHNFEEQNTSGKSFFEKTGLPKQYKDIFYHKNQFNSLKAGIHFADVVILTNEVYAKAVSENPDLSNGLFEFLEGKEVHIIKNGLDNYGLDPKKDKIIASKFVDDFEEFKYNNKVSLFQKFETDFDPSLPVFGMILDVNEYEAIDHFIENAPELLKHEKILFFVLARVEARYKNTLKLFAKKYKKCFKVIFTNELSDKHQLFAGSDFYLTLDSHDPTNYNAICAAKYGTIPIVNDYFVDQNILKPYDEKTGKGFTILFHREKLKEFQATIVKAIKIFEDKDTLITLGERGNAQNFSWENSAKEHKLIYTKLQKGK